MRRTISSLTLEEAMRLVPVDRFARWTIDAEHKEPGEFMFDRLRRLSAFDLTTTDAAKLLLIDVVLIEAVPDHSRLKVWKSAPLDSGVLSGVVDYVFSPNYAYLKTPLLCGVEAKGDDFVQGAAECVAAMVVSRSLNRAVGLEFDIYGIVSNGDAWLFYRLALDGQIFESVQYGLKDLPALLGVLNIVCAACAANAPLKKSTK